MATTFEEPASFVVISEISTKGKEAVFCKPSTKSDRLQKILKGEPLALGVTQIICGIIQLCFAVVFEIDGVRKYHFSVILFLNRTPFCLGILSIISGSLSIAVNRNPQKRLIRGNLIMNIITAVASAIFMILYAIHISFLYPLYFYCDYDNHEEQCGLFYQAQFIVYGMQYLLVIFSIPGFCLSIANSVFGCKALFRTAYSGVSVVIYQSTEPPGQPDVNAVPPSHPDVAANMTSFKGLEYESSS